MSSSSCDVEPECDTCGKMVPLSFIRVDTGTCMFCYQIELEHEVASSCSQGSNRLYEAMNASTGEGSNIATNDITRQ